MTKPIIMFGAGEIAELATYYFENDSDFTIEAYVVDDEGKQSDTFNGKPLVGMSEVTDKYPPSKFDAHVAISYRKLNQLRKKKYFEMKKKGYELVSYVCSKSFVWPDLTIGDNCFILENQTIQPTVTIGNNVMIWSGNHLGHGCSIGDHTYISSHVCISGHTKIGECNFWGVNSATKDFAVIGDNVFVAMGANITKDIKDDEMVLAAQSNVFEADNPLTVKVKKAYFGLD